VIVFPTCIYTRHTNSHGWRDSFTCDTTYLYVWHDSFTRLMWLMLIGDESHMSYMTHSHEWRDSSVQYRQDAVFMLPICITRLYKCHASLIWMTRLMHIWYDSIIIDFSHSHEWCDSCIFNMTQSYETSLVHMSDVTHLYNSVGRREKKVGVEDWGGWLPTKIRKRNKKENLEILEYNKEKKYGDYWIVLVLRIQNSLV